MRLSSIFFLSLLISTFFLFHPLFLISYHSIEADNRRLMYNISVFLFFPFFLSFFLFRAFFSFSLLDSSFLLFHRNKLSLLSSFLSFLLSFFLSFFLFRAFFSFSLLDSSFLLFHRSKWSLLSFFLSFFPSFFPFSFLLITFIFFFFPFLSRYQNKNVHYSSEVMTGQNIQTHEFMPYSIKMNNIGTAEDKWKSQWFNQFKFFNEKYSSF